MRDIATTTLSGNLTRDVELRQLPSGADVARLRIATTTRRRNGEEWVDKTNYFTIEVFGAQARACAQYLSKGSRVFVDAEPDWREWADQQDNKREAVTFKARQVLFEGGRPSTSNADGADSGTQRPPTDAAPSVPVAAAAGAQPVRRSRRPRTGLEQPVRTTCRSDVTAPSVICARFSEPDEWAAEIIRDRDIVERQTVRVTKTARPVMDGAATRAHVVGSAIVEGRIVMLETCVGDLWGMAADEEVQERASRIVRELEDELRGAGMEVRGGIWEAP